MPREGRGGRPDGEGPGEGVDEPPGRAETVRSWASPGPGHHHLGGPASSQRAERKEKGVLRGRRGTDRSLRPQDGERTPSCPWGAEGALVSM